jgi:hypothetical protein
VAITVIGILAPLANAATLTRHDSPHQTANAFTSMNAGVFLALLLGVLGTTGSARLPVDFGPPYRRAVGAKARAYGMVGAASVLVLGGIAAAVALPIIHARGIATPSSTVIGAYVERETVAGARLALLGVAIGLVAIRRRPAVMGLITFLILEALAEAYLPFIKNYGPIGALDAFSDPSHHHQLSVGAGSAVALGWALVTLVLATAISENRNARATSSVSARKPVRRQQTTGRSSSAA